MDFDLHLKLESKYENRLEHIQLEDISEELIAQERLNAYCDLLFEDEETHLIFKSKSNAWFFQHMLKLSRGGILLSLQSFIYALNDGLGKDYLTNERVIEIGQEFTEKYRTMLLKSCSRQRHSSNLDSLVNLMCTSAESTQILLMMGLIFNEPIDKIVKYEADRKEPYMGFVKMIHEYLELINMNTITEMRSFLPESKSLRGKDEFLFFIVSYSFEQFKEKYPKTLRDYFKQKSWLKTIEETYGDFIPIINLSQLQDDTSHKVVRNLNKDYLNHLSEADGRPNNLKTIEVKSISIKESAKKLEYVKSKLTSFRNKGLVDFRDNDLKSILKPYIAKEKYIMMSELSFKWNEKFGQRDWRNFMKFLRRELEPLEMTAFSRGMITMLNYSDDVENLRKALERDKNKV